MNTLEIAPLVIAVLLLGCGEAKAPLEEKPLFGDPSALELLVEQSDLGDPTSDEPNRFFRGWKPVDLDGKVALQSVPAGGYLQVVALTARDRRLILDLAPEQMGGADHIQIRIDSAAPLLVPMTDPLILPLSGDIAPGRHTIELSAGGPQGTPVVVADAQLRPAASGGKAHVENGALRQSGPAIVDLYATPNRGWSLTGELCPEGFLPSTAGLSLEITSVAGEELARWDGDGSFLDRLRRCREIELLPTPSTGPVRIRFRATENARKAKWINWRWRLETRAEPPAPSIAQSPATPPFSPPRLVILYVLDALRADHLGYMGGLTAISPTIDRLAQEGFAFRDHRSTAPNTLPSIRHLFTGKTLVNQAAWRDIGKRLPTLAETFGNAGYRTALFSGNGYVSPQFGLARGFAHVSQEALFDPADTSLPGVNESAVQVHRAALKWLETVGQDEKVFLYLQTIHPHNPYAPPPRLETRYTRGIPSSIEGSTKVLRAITRGRRSFSDADRRRLRGLYAASVTYNDIELARFLSALGTLVPPTETLLVLTSDHGEELFDHEGALHGYTLYEELLRIPMLVWAPGRVKPGQTSDLTDALDLHATLVDLVPAPEATFSEGRSLLPLLGGGTAPPQKLHFSVAEGIPGGAFAVRKGPWKYIWVRGNDDRWAIGQGPARSWDREYFFDLASDRSERRNLAGGGTVLEAWLRQELRSWVAARLGEKTPLDEDSEEPIVNEDVRRRLRALGYVE